MAQTGEDLHVTEKTGGPLLGANMLLLQKTKAHDDVPINTEAVCQQLLLPCPEHSENGPASQ